MRHRTGRYHAHTGKELTVYERRSVFIGGEWVVPSTSGESIEVVSPATEQLVGVAAACGEDDVDLAVASATRAFQSGWANWDPARRADALSAFARALKKRAVATSTLVTSENGMPISVSGPIEGGAWAIVEYYARLLRDFNPERRQSAYGRGTTVVRQEPVGVVAAIAPWNFPQSLSIVKIAPALAAGCTVVLKPAPATTLDAFVFADAAEEAGLPPGVLNIVTGGANIGRALVEHPAVNKVSFTGSTAVGRWIGQRCGQLLRPVNLELGGKSAAIILDDVDLTTAMRGLARASLTNSGQTCWSSTRILAPRRRYDEIVDAVADMVASQIVGDPFDSATTIGPLISSEHRIKVDDYIAHGCEHSRLIIGGGRPANLTAGWFVEPTVFADVAPSSPIFRDEIFGPVLAITGYDDDDDAVRLANDSEYGLAGTVWTSDVERGLDVARRVHTGVIGVNNFDLDVGAPFGGVKGSGLGRELGPDGLASFLRPKSIYLRSDVAVGNTTK